MHKVDENVFMDTYFYGNNEEKKLNTYLISFYFSKKICNLIDGLLQF